LCKLKLEGFNELKKKVTRAPDKPRVSIGLPVFNGEKYLEETLDSILAQEYTDFELIISDNASTDQTQQICSTYASRDGRIRYYRNEVNFGGSYNYNRVFKLSSGEYFKWAAHDDILAPDYLMKCINILDKEPCIILCHSKTSCIDEYGTIIGTYESGKSFDSQKSYERFGNLINFYSHRSQIFGVIRASTLRKTKLLKNHIGSDVNLLAEILLLGKIYIIPEYLFFLRKHQQSYSGRALRARTQVLGFQEISEWWRPQFNRKKTKIYALIKYTYNFREFFRSVKNAPLTRFERLLCYAQLIKWFIREGYMSVFYDIANILFHHSKLVYKLALNAKSLFKKMKMKLVHARASGF